mmetsp:Transcript_3582/g.5422  ORF Transcript_3582/g.5422 Transcript_3582/m.5422 type:complete len:382 (-) Transcript_3582:156-1301(-)
MTRNRKAGKSAAASIVNMPERREPKPPVTYSDSNHLSVIFQAHGSVWCHVLPYCIFNTLIAAGVYIAKNNYGYDITCKPLGHKFMAMMVSFLLIGRVQIIFSRFMEARGHLSTCYRSCRELIQHMAVLTMQDKSEGAMQWRQLVAERTILLLLVTMGSIEFRSSQKKPWDVPELCEEERRNLESVMLLDDAEKEGTVKTKMSRFAHGRRTLLEESDRAPIILAYDLRKAILSTRQAEVLQVPFRHVNEELKLLDMVSGFLKAYAGLKKLINTPFPFPLVQMARTFLFFWVFTLPFALCSNAKELPGILLSTFFITYGFVGLEYVSMELDDPFGDDPNDFDDLGMAEMVFEDIYITLYKLDGDASVQNLRMKLAGVKVEEIA